jgi:hypothetical protein
MFQRFQQSSGVQPSKVSASGAPLQAQRGDDRRHTVDIENMWNYRIIIVCLCMFLKKITRSRTWWKFGWKVGWNMWAFWKESERTDLSKKIFKYLRQSKIWLQKGKEDMTPRKIAASLQDQYAAQADLIALDASVCNLLGRRAQFVTHRIIHEPPVSCMWLCYMIHIFIDLLYVY